MKFAHRGLLAINPLALGLEFFIGGVPDRQNRRIGDAAVVDINGPLEHHAGPAFDNYVAIKDRVREALATDAKRVVLAFDSPGGLVSGVYETASEIEGMARAARKPLLAYVSGECCSAAYALACACERIVVPAGASVGSIGVMALPVDATAADGAMGLQFFAISSGARKLDGNPHVPMTKSAIAALQKNVDEQAAVFFELVANARGMAREAVKGFQAGIFVGDQAVQVGLADEVSTLEGFVNSTATAAETMAMTYKELRKALGEKSAGDDEEAKKCRRALAAMDDDMDGDVDKKDDKKESKAENGDDDEAKAKAAKAEDSEEKKAKAESDDEAKAKAIAGNPVVALGAQVQSLASRFAAKEEAEERTRLMATRPDFDEAVVKALATEPIEIVKFAVSTFPKGKIKAPNQVTAAQVAATAPITRGEGQGEIGDVGRFAELRDLDVAMGLAPASHAIRHEGTRMVLGVMTPAQARAMLAERAKTVGGK